MNFKKNYQYFFPSKPDFGIFLIIIGSIVAVIGIGISNVFAAAIGFLILGIGIVVVVNINSNNTKGYQLDQIVNEMLQRIDIKSKALAKLGIDEDQVKEINPIFIDGYYYQPIQSQSWYRRDTKDHILRSSNYQISVLFFSQHQVFSYTYAFSLIRYEELENTDEYFYRDIVSAATQSGTIMLNTGTRENANFEYFRLTSSGGTSISMSIRSSTDPYLQMSINAMKQFLRDKKLQLR